MKYSRTHFSCCNLSTWENSSPYFKHTKGNIYHINKSDNSNNKKNPRWTYDENKHVVT